MQDTATDHYPTRSIDELATMAELLNRVLSFGPTAPEISILRGMLTKIDASVKAKRLAAPTPLFPRQRDRM